ncbi:hypothetical protein M7775_13635 [Sporomusa sphaeroides DSM 2875]|uniref:hypothetical protein n=1 Tax=Sporomusa sphaeroides TaxID=47679 RepID=UPI00202E88E8|nr:hypothetical protein [Sporomusa sphaeroides]MCM0759595.1 hypothetical protein [Sporomusa sphaeroides DSM 2875]
MNEKHIKALIEAVKTDIAKIAAETAAKTTIAELEKQKRLKIKSRHDKRLRNTRLLLKHYNYFRDHANNSVYKYSQLKALEMLDELEDCRSDIYIQSIKQSAAKTSIIVSHINFMLDIYQVYCDRSGETEQRKLRVLKSFYLDKTNRYDVMQRENISERTYFRDIDDGIDTLSAMIFGIDAIHEMTE